jgi:DNA-binding MarR family transcriptional regulator
VADPPVLHRHLGRLLRDTHLRAHEKARERLPGGRHPRDWGVMAVIDEDGPVSQQQLAELLGVHRTMMVGIIDALERDGLVARTRNPDDRRSYALELTRAGEQALARTTPEIVETERAFMGALSATRRARLAELLRALVSAERTRPLPPVLADRPGYLLAAAHRLSKDRFEAVLEPFGLDAHGFAALIVLAEIGPSSQQRLAEELALSGTMVVQVVDALESAGLVERRRSETDRRVNLVHLTEVGAETERSVMDARAEIMGDITARLAEGEEAELCALLRALLAQPS